MTTTMSADYPTRYEQLGASMARFELEAPAVMQGFAALHAAATAEGALSETVKELISLAIGITVRCDGCIAYHVHDALQAGATRAEIIETIGVAVMMGGGPSVVYGCEAMQALDQFELAEA